MRQFQAEPEAQPGSTQPYFSQTQPDGGQMDCDTSLEPLRHAFMTEEVTSDFNNSLLRHEVNVRGQNEADQYPQQQDVSSFYNMDFEHLDHSGAEGIHQPYRSHEAAQGSSLLVNKRAVPSLNTMHKRTRLAPRITFSKDSFAPTPPDEIAMEQVKFDTRPTAVSRPNTPPADLMDDSEFAALHPHLFDLSLSPILDLPRLEEENTGSPQAQPDNNSTGLAEMATQPGTEEIVNRISSDQTSKYAVEADIQTGTREEEATSGPHFSQNQQNARLVEGKMDNDTGKVGDLIINSEGKEVTSVPSHSGIFCTDTRRGITDEQSHTEENRRLPTEDTELPHGHCYGTNEGVDILNTDSMSHSEAVVAGQNVKTQTDVNCGDSDTHVQPPPLQNVNEVNTAGDVILEHDGEVNPKTAERRMAWSESFDLLDVTADVTSDVAVQSKSKGRTSEEQPRVAVKDSAQQVDVSPAVNKVTDSFDTSFDMPSQPILKGLRTEKHTRDISGKLQVTCKTSSVPHAFTALEEHIITRQSIQTPKKPTFRAPYKVVSESPIVGYPANRRNVTSTPKGAQQKAVLRHGSGYASDSSDTVEETRNASHCKARHLTGKVDVRAGETSSALCHKSLKRKVEFKQQFVSKLSAFKFSVDYKKRNLNEDLSCHKETTEASRQMSFKPKFVTQTPINPLAPSSSKPNVRRTAGFVNRWNCVKAKDKSENVLTEKTDEAGKGKSDMMQDVNMSATHSKEPAGITNSAGAGCKNVDESARKLNEFGLNDDQTFDSVVSEDVSGTRETCNLDEEMEAGTADKQVTKPSLAAKISAKRKKEHQAQTAAASKNKKTRITESHVPRRAGKGDKKTRKRNNTSESSTKGKSKGVGGCLGEDEMAHRESKSGKKQALVAEASQTSVDLSQCLPQVDHVQHPLGNETQLLAVSQHLTNAQEFCLSLLYRDSSSQLRERVSGSRKQHPGSGQVTALALRVTWALRSAPPRDLLPTGAGGEVRQVCGSNTTAHQRGTISAVYRISLGINFNKEEIRSVVSCIMKSETHKIGFDAQETITFLVEKLEIEQREVVSSWVILDPKVGGWLLDSDHPPVTFQQTASALQVPLCQAGAGRQPEEEIRSDLQALSIVAAALHTRLLQLNLWTIFLQLEMRITPILAVMELRDIKVDRSILKHMGQRLKLKIEEVERQCHQVCGSVFNVASHAQLRSILYQELKLDVKAGVAVPRTTKGQKSTCEAALGRLQDVHPLPGLVQKHRLLNKLKTTYVDGILACLHGSCVRAAWEQTTASTGRIQCHHPNLQNIPKQPVTVEVNGSEMAVRARECFCSREGHVLVSADFQQTELRVLAHLSQDAVLLEGFRQPSHSNTDIFKQLSATWLGKAVSEVSSSERERTKRVVYGVMYGAGREKLSEVLHIKQSEANEIISSFMKHFPGIPAYTRSVIDACRQQGFLTTIFRRRRSFPGITSHNMTVQSQAERQAVNFIIQGSAADLSKAAMVQTEAALARWPEINAKLLIHIHDELVWEVQTEHTRPFCDLVGRIMEDTQQLCGPLVQLTVPLPVTVSTGTSWAHMHPLTNTTTTTTTEPA